jgi:hypothetical protein
MADDNVSVKFGAATEGLEAGLASAVSAIQSGVGQMREHFEGLKSVIEKVNVAMMSIGAVLAGGAVFREAVAKTNELADAQFRLMGRLGITATEAAGLDQALNEVGSTGEAYAMSFTRFTRQIKSHGDELKALGVDMDGFNKGQVSSNEIFLQAVQGLMKYKAGIDQTGMSLQLFGRNIQGIQAFARLSKEQIEEATKSAEALGLVTTEAELAQRRAYQMMKANAGDAIDAIQKKIGNALLPVLIKMGDWFIAQGPAIVDGFEKALQGLAAVLESIGEALGAFKDLAVLAFQGVGSAIMGAFGQSSEQMTAMKLFENSMKLLGATIIGVSTAFQLFGEFVKGNSAGIVAELMRLGETYAVALNPKNWTLSTADFGKLVADQWRKSSEMVEFIEKDHQAKMEAIHKEGQDRIRAMIMGDFGEKAKSPAAKPPGGELTAPTFDKALGASVDAALKEMQKLQTGMQSAWEKLIAEQEKYTKEAKKLWQDAEKTITDIQTEIRKNEIGAEPKEVQDSEKIQEAYDAQQRSEMLLAHATVARYAGNKEGAADYLNQAKEAAQAALGWARSVENVADKNSLLLSGGNAMAEAQREQARQAERNAKEAGEQADAVQDQMNKNEERIKGLTDLLDALQKKAKGVKVELDTDEAKKKLQDLIDMGSQLVKKQGLAPQPVGGEEGAAEGAPEFAEGGYITKGGMARLHPNERVLNPEQTKQWSMMRLGGGAPTFNVQPTTGTTPVSLAVPGVGEFPVHAAPDVVAAMKSAFDRAQLKSGRRYSSEW